jgi:hypothetical protein
MPVKLSSTGGGSVTLTTPSTATDYTATFPAATGNVVTTGSSAVVTPAMLSTGAPSWDSSGVLSFNSGYGSVATAYGCRAWVNFNGSGTVAIRASGNVTSITDNGTGDYTVNFTNAMPDANYVVLGLGYAATSDNSSLRGIEQRGAPTTGSARIMTFNGINTFAYDGDYVNVAIFR